VTADVMSAVAPLRIAVAGAGGRMGRMLVDAVLADPGCTLSGALDQPGSPLLGSDAAGHLDHRSGVPITDVLAQGLFGAQVLIDFTRPEGTLAHLAACRAAGVRLVIGTTGFDAEQRALITDAAEHIGIVMAPNMSVGVNVVLKLLAVAARVLDDSFDVEVVEAHHRHKVDAPSGTALAMGEAVAHARGRTLADSAVWARQGFTGERRSGSIGFATLRGGDIVGDHTVLFAGDGERIEITHKSSSRRTYAEGALRAAKFLATRGPGLFGMDHVLGLADGG